MGYTAILDYGVGNLQSITNAFRYLGLETKVTSEAAELERADSIVLPGVGAFPNAAEKLRQSGLSQSLLSAAKTKPMLGICLGMQLLFEQSEEGEITEGLGLLRGQVKRIETSKKLPHIGWNTLRFTQETSLLQGLDQGCSVYFVHSFAAQATDHADLLATTDYGTEVVAAVGKGNVFGCQFHPEKSGEVGLQILKNFGEMSR